jgi:hypothetical protein
LNPFCRRLFVAHNSFNNPVIHCELLVRFVNKEVFLFFFSGFVFFFGFFSLLKSLA